MYKMFITDLIFVVYPKTLNPPPKNSHFPIGFGQRSWCLQKYPITIALYGNSGGYFNHWIMSMEGNVQGMIPESEKEMQLPWY